MGFVTFKMYTLIAELRCIMDKSELEFLQFLSKQNQEFLQKVKGQRVYYFDDVMNKKSRLIARFSDDGRNINFPKIWAVPFKQSFSPNHGIYQLYFDRDIYYVGILVKDHLTLLYDSYDFDDIFKINEKRIFLSPHPIKSL